MDVGRYSRITWCFGVEPCECFCNGCELSRVVGGLSGPDVSLVAGVQYDRAVYFEQCVLHVGAVCIIDCETPPGRVR